MHHDDAQVKAVLDLYKVPYATLDVNPLTKVRPSVRPDDAHVCVCNCKPLRRRYREHL